MSHISISQARQGEMVTTQTEYDGIGLGYLVNGKVYVSTGNGFAVEGNESFPRVVGFICDDGVKYHLKALELLGV